MLTESLILIGMPGAGKTTVGKYIAERLKAEFVDTDRLIIDAAGKPLQNIISEEGMDAFKEMERNLLNGFTPEENCVIATGGSAVLYEDAMQHLKTLGKVIFLDVDLPLIKKRLWNAENRGIAFDGESDDRILDIYMQREPLYYKYSDIRIHIRGKTVAEIGKEIISSVS